MKIALIRHTRVSVPLGICYGRTEVPLAPTFDQEALVVLRNLPWAPSVVWTSPAQRCRRLAEFLARGVPIEVDDRLTELDFGAWEGRPWNELQNDGSEIWALDPWYQAPPGGETGKAFQLRVAAVQKDILTADAKKIAVITHAGVIRAWRGLRSKCPYLSLWDEPIGYGSIWPI